jgi:hypothetical protein
MNTTDVKTKWTLQFQYNEKKMLKFDTKASLQLHASFTYILDKLINKSIQRQTTLTENKVKKLHLRRIRLRSYTYENKVKKLHLRRISS